MIEKFKLEDKNRVANFILYQAILKPGQDDILKNQKMHSYSVIPYVPNNEHLVTVSMIYQDKATLRFFEFSFTFNVDDYFNWYTPIDRRIKIEKLRSKYEYLVY